MNNSRILSQELTELTTEKLYEKLSMLKKEFFNIRFQHSLGELKNTSQYSVIKKNIARINTEIAKRVDEEDLDA